MFDEMSTFRCETAEKRCQCQACSCRCGAADLLRAQGSTSYSVNKDEMAALVQSVSTAVTRSRV